MHGRGINHHTNLGKKRSLLKPIWNKGLTKETDARVLRSSKTISKVIRNKVANGSFNKSGWSLWTQKQKEYWSKRMSSNNQGGKSKWFEVSGYKVQGTWERDFALKLNDYNISWKRCSPIVYCSSGKEKRYTPDFYLINFDKFIEIKGYWWGNDKEKMNHILNSNPHLISRLIIVEKEKYEKIMKSKEDFFEMLR